jgi:hypothetical protein
LLLAPAQIPACAANALGSSLHDLRQKLPTIVRSLPRYESRLFGADSRKLGLIESAVVLSKLAPLFEQGSLGAPLVQSVLPLERGIDAFQAVAAGAEARIVIEP